MRQAPSPVGELDRFWAVATTGSNALCSCGGTLTECVVWSRVIRHQAVASAIGRRRQDRGGRSVASDDAAALNRAIAQETGCTTIIDSSKSLRAMLRAARDPRSP